MKQSLIKMAKGMLVVLFLSYYVSSTMFYHTHHFFWGSVTHSHPYFPASDTDAANHSHTPAQCQAISLLTNLLLIFTVAAVFLCKTTIVQRIYTRVHTFKSCFQALFSPLRAPPVFICQ